MPRRSLLAIVVVRVALTVAVAFTIAAAWGYAGMRRSLVEDLDRGRWESEGVDAALDRARRQLAIVGVVATLAAVAGSWLLTRKALGSIVDVAAQARSVEGGTVGQRIRVETTVRESAELVRVLNDLLERLDRAFEWQRRLIADLGHDIRTPITVLRAGAEAALLRDRPAERYREVIAGSLEEIDRLALISDSLLLLARFEAGALDPVHEPVAVAPLLADVVARSTSAGGIVSLDVPAGFDGSAQPLLADSRMLGLAVEELLHNAIAHNPPGTPVAVTVRGEPDTVTFSVEDRGRGVDPAVLPRLFELGFRTDRARGRSGGAGLGLTVVAAVTAVHGGRVLAAAGPSGGLRVSLTLPRVPHENRPLKPSPAAQRAGLPIVTPAAALPS